MSKKRDVVIAATGAALTLGVGNIPGVSPAVAAASTTAAVVTNEIVRRVRGED